MEIRQDVHSDLDSLMEIFEGEWPDEKLYYCIGTTA